MPRPERKPQFHAWETYRDMGYRRSFRQTAKLEKVNQSTVARWAKMYGWAERLKKYAESVAKKQAEGALIETNDPAIIRLNETMKKAEAVINSAFDEDENGILTPKRELKVKNLDELTKFIGEYRKLLETQYRITAKHMPAGKEKKRDINIEEFNQYMGSLPQEERIAAMKGTKNEPKKDRHPKRAIQDADYTEIPGQGDED